MIEMVQPFDLNPLPPQLLNLLIFSVFLFFFQAITLFNSFSNAVFHICQDAVIELKASSVLQFLRVSHGCGTFDLTRSNFKKKQGMIF